MFKKINIFIILYIFIYYYSNNITKTNSDTKKEMFEKKKLNLKKIESFELKLDILKSHHWDPIDSKILIILLIIVLIRSI